MKNLIIMTVLLFAGLPVAAEEIPQPQIYKVAGNAEAAETSGGECLEPTEKAAFNTRVLQTELMEAALSCPELQKNYNEFVKKYKQQLMEQSKNMQAYFKRVYGPLADPELNHFITKLANDTSEVNFGKQQHGFCTYAEEKFERLKQVKPAGFAEFAIAEKSEVSYKAPGCKR